MLFSLVEKEGRTFVDVFSETVAAISADTLTFGDTRQEALENTWRVSIGSGSDLTVEDVCSFIEDARAAYQSIAVDLQAPNLWFYAWVDEMAGQLRLSISSSDALPFTGQISTTADAPVIAAELLASPYLGGIPFSEFDEDCDNDLPEPEPPALNVYLVPLAG